MYKFTNASETNLLKIFEAISILRFKQNIKGDEGCIWSISTARRQSPTNSRGVNNEEKNYYIHREPPAFRLHWFVYICDINTRN